VIWAFAFGVIFGLVAAPFVMIAAAAWLRTPVGSRE
jgi:hypothetical protein